LVQENPYIEKEGSLAERSRMAASTDSGLMGPPTWLQSLCCCTAWISGKAEACTPAAASGSRYSVPLIATVPSVPPSREAILWWISALLERPVQAALHFARQQPVADVDETGAPNGNADGNNPTGKRGWLWVMVTAMVTVFIQGLSRSTAAGIELLGSAFGGILLSGRFSGYNHLPLEQRQLCWAQLILDLTAIAERPGASTEFGAELLDLQRQLFGHGTATRSERSIGPPRDNPADRSDRPLRQRCSRWWSWATSGASEHHGPRRSAPASRSCS
jgi:hypothetical protein